jgi:hypothetical protein
MFWQGVDNLRRTAPTSPITPRHTQPSFVTWVRWASAAYNAAQMGLGSGLALQRRQGIPFATPPYRTLVSGLALQRSRASFQHLRAHMFHTPPSLAGGGCPHTYCAQNARQQNPSCQILCPGWLCCTASRIPRDYLAATGAECTWGTTMGHTRHPHTVHLTATASTHQD